SGRSLASQHRNSCSIRTQLNSSCSWFDESEDPFVADDGVHVAAPARRSRARFGVRQEFPVMVWAVSIARTMTAPIGASIPAGLAARDWPASNASVAWSQDGGPHTLLAQSTTVGWIGLHAGYRATDPAALAQRG